MLLVRYRVLGGAHLPERDVRRVWPTKRTVLRGKYPVWGGPRLPEWNLPVRDSRSTVLRWYRVRNGNDLPGWDVRQLWWLGGAVLHVRRAVYRGHDLPERSLRNPAIIGAMQRRRGLFLLV